MTLMKPRKKLLELLNKRALTIIAGDFNAKTGGSAWKTYGKNIGKFEKGHLNSNGERLLELCLKQLRLFSNQHHVQAQFETSNHVDQS